MNKDKILVTSADQHRIRICSLVLSGELTLTEAAEFLDRSVRQTRRVVKRFAEHGVAGIGHGNRERLPAHALAGEARTRILELLRGPYAAMNDCHAADLLAERDDIVVSRSTVRRLRQESGLAPIRSRRTAKHRSRRERLPRAGMLIQIDGSHHRWFGPGHPRCVLLAAIDDATSQIVAAVFSHREDAAGYLTLLQRMITTVGRPEAVYHDGHGIFAANPRERETLAEQFAGQRAPTQVGRALLELDIASIRAWSPQAKGRVERLFGTLQDRLVKEFALDGITTLAAAQAALDTFIVRHNTAFQVPPADPAPAWRQLTPTQHAHQICAFAYTRTVAADNTVSLDGRTLQLLPSPTRSSFAKCQVELRHHLDDTISVWFNQDRLATQAAPVSPSTLRASSTRRLDPFAQRADPLPPPPAPDDPNSEDPAPQPTAPRSRKPKPDHPWRQSFNLKGTKSKNS